MIESLKLEKQCCLWSNKKALHCLWNQLAYKVLITTTADDILCVCFLVLFIRHTSSRFLMLFHAKTYNKTCATSEDSDQPAHLHSLIRVFSDNMCLLQPPGYPKRDKQEPLSYWVDVQDDLSFCWSHRSDCRFCHALTYMSLNTSQPLYNTVCYNTVLYITRFKDGSQKCIDYIEKWP